MKELEESIECTKLLIFASFKQKDVTCSAGLIQSLDFITEECLTRPPFQFVHALTSIYVKHLSFARGLYDDSELILSNMKSRKDKIRFIFKILVCVAKLTQERVDIFISPVKLLSGQEVLATHKFLCCLARASSISCEKSAAVAAEILQIGDSNLYKISVKTRNNITKLQAVIRGKHTRITIKKDVIDHHSDITSCSRNIEKRYQCHDIGVFCEVYRSLAFECGHGMGQNVTMKCCLREPVAPGSSDDEDGPTMIDKNNSFNRTSQNKQEAMQKISDLSLTSKRKFSDEDKSGDKSMPIKSYEDNKRSIDRAESHIKPVQLKMKGNHSKLELDKRKERQETSIMRGKRNRSKETKKLKKCKIINGVVTRQELYIPIPLAEVQETEESRIRAINENEADLKRKTKRLKDREVRLNERLEEMKQKEEHLALHEDRVKRLAESLRKQQTKLKQEGLRQAMEIDQLKLQTALRSADNKQDHHQDNKDPQRFSDEILRQAEHNPTMTDLRLALERKERSLRRRQERMNRAEKDLRKRIVQFEEKELASAETEIEKKTQFSRSIACPNISFTKKKKIEKLTSNSNAISSSKDTKIKNAAPFINLVNETIRRRQAFVPATQPQELRRVSKISSISEKKSEMPPMALLTIPNKKSFVLSTITEEEDMKKKSPMRVTKSLPRSLVDYTNHCNENSRQKYVTALN